MGNEDKALSFYLREFGACFVLLCFIFKRVVKSIYFELCFNKVVTTYMERSLKHLKISVS